MISKTYQKHIKKRGETPFFAVCVNDIGSVVPRCVSVLKAKDLLERHFTKDVDYILINYSVNQHIHTKGGHNKKVFMLFINL